MSTPHLFIVSPVLDDDILVQECIASVKAQTYQYWTMCIIVDDAINNQKTVVAARNAAGNDTRIKVVETEGRLYALQTRLLAIHQHCPHGSVVVLLDGDDKLLGNESLSKVAKKFEDPCLDFLWTQFKYSNGGIGFCCDLPVGANPFHHRWVTSHMQCFRKKLVWGVPPELFLDKDGSCYRSGTDQALVLPILSLAKNRIFLPEVMYQYNVTNKTNLKVQTAGAATCRQMNMDRYPFKDKNVLMIVNGPQHQYDMRLSMGERRAPLGVLSMCAHLRARGHNVRLVDRFLNPGWFPSDEAIRWADAIGIYVSSPNHTDGEFVVRAIRTMGFKGMIMAGGPHTILFPDQVKSWGVDVTCDAEADFLISHIVEKGSMPGKYARRIQDLNTIPFPDYDLVQQQGIRYESGWPFGQHGKVMTLNTSRSCPHACAFCETRALWGRKWSGQSPERIILDVRHAKTFGAQAVYFREDNFGASRKRLTDVCRMLSREQPIAWACELRADIGCEEEVIEMMHTAGCKAIYVGAESGSDKILKLMNKGITTDQIRAMCRHVKKNGMVAALSFVDGFPGEGPEDVAATNNLVKECSTGVVWRNSYRQPKALKLTETE